jgi:membrane protease YdiL (CAAX protease family)
MTPERRRAHFADSVLVFSAAVGVMIAAGAARAVWARESPVWVRQALLVSMQLAWIALPFAYLAVAGARIRETLSLRLPAASVWPRLFVLWLSMSWLTMGLHHGQTALFEGLGWDFGPQARGVNEMLGELWSWGAGFVILIVVVLASLGEELVFRGAMLGGFSRSFGGARGVVYTSLLFAAVHQMLPRMTITFFLAVVFALAVRWTGSLWAAVALHALNNFGAGLFGSLYEAPPSGWLVALAGATFALALASLRGARPAEPPLRDAVTDPPPS